MNTLGRWAAVLRACAVLSLTAVSVGCASGPRPHEADVALWLNSAAYQIGQPVEATVSVTNSSTVDLVVPALDNSTLKFRWAQPGSGQAFVRKPVLPEFTPAEPRVVGPGKSTSRTFLFTGLTGEPGEWGLIVSLHDCRSAGAEDMPLPAYHSKPAAFAVSKNVMFERDPYSGIIVRGQAVALARKAGGLDETVPARAVLVPIGETGLHVWVVLLGAEEDPLKAAAAFTVNPYSGVVRALEVGGTSQERTKE